MLHSYTLKNDKKAKGIRFVLFLFMVVIQATAFAQGGMKITIQKPSRLSLKEQDLLMELKEIILILFLNPKQELWLLNR